MRKFIEKNFCKSLIVNILLATVGGIAQSVSPMPLTFGMLITGIVGMCATFAAGLGYVADATSHSRDDINIEEYRSENIKSEQKVYDNQQESNATYNKTKDSGREM